MTLAALDSLWIFLIVIGSFGVIAIIAFIIYRLLRPKLKGENKEEEKTEEDYAKEELDRILQPVEDEQVSNEIQSAKQDEDEEDSKD